MNSRWLGTMNQSEAYKKNEGSMVEATQSLAPERLDQPRVAGLQGQQSEFDRLVRRYHKQAYNIAYRMTGNHADAEDLTQEAFVRAFRFFGNYRRDWHFDNW